MGYLATHIRLFFLAALTFLVIPSALAFPTGGGGCYFCSPYTFGGSTITFDLTSNDENDLAPITFNFLEDSANPGTGKLCLSGKIRATIVDDTGSGEATYDLLGADGTNRGVCYHNVTQAWDDILDDDGSLFGSCSGQKVTYTIPALETFDATELSALLDGRFKIDKSLLMTGPYAVCATSSPTNVCNFEVGFGFAGDPAPADFFPATTTLNGDTVVANVVLYANEVCVECGFGNFGLDSDSLALKSKSDTIRACEALSIKTDWCNDLQSLGDPSCIGDGDASNPPLGGMNTAMGDFQNQDVSGAVCITDIQDLKTLASCDSEVAIAGCGDGPGFIIYPATFEGTSCSISGNDAEMYSYSSAQGGGTSEVNLVAIGANSDAPGYAGDNTLPPVLAGWTAVVSTPDNQVNIWDFSGTDMHRVAYIHTRNNDDVVTGSLGTDNILGGSGADILNGNDGDDVLQGGDNSDELYGDNGNDLLLGYACEGPNANCSLFNNNGSEDDILGGGDGNDCLDGGRGNDSVTGGNGNDAFVLFGNTGSDTVTDYTQGEDVFVDMVGNASASWVKGSKRDGIPNVCKVTTGGNNASTVEGINSMTSCNNITIVDVTDGGAMPAQCAAHAYNF
jgi:hypothetical protein